MNPRNTGGSCELEPTHTSLPEAIVCISSQLRINDATLTARITTDTMALVNTASEFCFFFPSISVCQHTSDWGLSHIWLCEKQQKLEDNALKI